MYRTLAKVSKEKQIFPSLTIELLAEKYNPANDYIIIFSWLLKYLLFLTLLIVSEPFFPYQIYNILMIYICIISIILLFVKSHYLGLVHHTIIYHKIDLAGKNARKECELMIKNQYGNTITS